ncbi:APC family permease [Longispora fulva]|uniref:Amino acid transporter n=1 Tax=Longispora fulva TaxID=619741 RepID=A0A8J7KLT5_9ACTN|nr:APC family permease [Longispora fulva]MBG6138351.1 amino acid transporter [Longispora fulva]
MSLARNRLGASPVLFFLLSAAAPLTVVAGVVTAGYASTANTALPAGFVLVGIVLAVFMVGYLAMSKAVPNAGAFYAYVAVGIGRVPAVGVAWTAMVSYFAVQMAAYGAIGAAAGPLIHLATGWNLPWWVIALACWAGVGLLGVRRIDLSGKVLALLGAAEICVVLVFDVANLLPASHPGHDIEIAASFNPAGLLTASGGAVLVLAVLAFAGVEQGPVYGEEARTGSVPRATYLAVGLIIAVYAISSWAMTVPAGPARTLQLAAEQGPELLFTNAAANLSTAWATAGRVLFATSLFAAMLSFHNTTARYVFALGRERVLPAVFGRASRRTFAPKAGSLAQSTIAFMIIAVYAAAGWDPLTKLFYLAGTGGAFGILVLLTVTSAAVVAFFADPAHRQLAGVWTKLIAPTVACAALAAMTVLALTHFASVLGVSDDSALRWAIPTGLAAIGLAGCGWGLYLRAARPGAYRVIGRGTAAVLPTPILPEVSS